MGVAFELFLAALGGGLLHLNDDIGDRGAVGIEDDDVGTLRGIPPERDRILNLETGGWVFVFGEEKVKPKLAGDLLRLGHDFLAAHLTFQIRLPVLFGEELLNGPDGFLRKVGGAGKGFEEVRKEVGNGHGGEYGTGAGLVTGFPIAGLAHRCLYRLKPRWKIL